MSDSEVKVQVLLLVVAAAAFVVLTLWCFRHLPAGRWAGLGALGAGLLGLSLGIGAASDFERIFLDSSHIAMNLFVREHVTTLLLAARTVGAVLLLLAFVESRRTPPGADPTYGP